MWIDGPVRLETPARESQVTGRSIHVLKKAAWAVWVALLTVIGLFGDAFATWTLWREWRGGPALKGERRRDQ